jgi:hypothetical protein
MYREGDEGVTITIMILALSEFRDGPSWEVSTARLFVELAVKLRKGNRQVVWVKMV